MATSLYLRATTWLSSHILKTKSGYGNLHRHGGWRHRFSLFMILTCKWARPGWTIFFVAISILLSSCSASPEENPEPERTPTQKNSPLDPVNTVISPTGTPSPPTTMRVCLSEEPESLFIYGGNSLTTRSILQAIYDGPVDIQNYQYVPVILEGLPNLENGGSYLEQVEVGEGDLIVDLFGKPATLKEGVMYRPAGCRDAECALLYGGTGSIFIDQLVVRYKLLEGINWSDGEPLTADDSVFAFEISRDFYPRVKPDMLDRTQSYLALDELNVEWRGLPGYFDPHYQANFFSPLPRHLWDWIPSEELFTSETSARTPIGWGPFKIDNWVPGEGVFLSRNPGYFRAGEGLPFFDRLEFLFVSPMQDVIDLVRSGECDYLDEGLSQTITPEQSSSNLQDGEVSMHIAAGGAWEHIDFGIESLDPSLPRLFNERRVRQAVAYCLDRQKIVEEVMAGAVPVLDNYLPPDHPLASSIISRYPYNSQSGASLLQEAGWVDMDNDPTTPRIAQGVPQVVDGTELIFTIEHIDTPQNQIIVNILTKSLGECGIQVNSLVKSSEELYAPGPGGSIFGRQFSTALFPWTISVEPPCFLYTTEEIPGPYPDYPKGWGGANASGYSNLDYDSACLTARTTLPDWSEHLSAHHSAQSYYTSSLPSIPLYLHAVSIITRSELCGFSLDPSAATSLWGIENFSFAENCSN